MPGESDTVYNIQSLSSKGDNVESQACPTLYPRLHAPPLPAPPDSLPFPHAPNYSLRDDIPKRRVGGSQAQQSPTQETWQDGVRGKELGVRMVEGLKREEVVRKEEVVKRMQDKVLRLEMEVKKGKERVLESERKVKEFGGRLGGKDGEKVVVQGREQATITLLLVSLTRRLASLEGEGRGEQEVRRRRRLEEQVEEARQLRRNIMRRGAKVDVMVREKEGDEGVEELRKLLEEREEVVARERRVEDRLNLYKEELTRLKGGR